MSSAKGMSALLLLLVVPSVLGPEESGVSFDEVDALLPLPVVDAADEPFEELGIEVEGFVPPAATFSVCAAERKAS